MGPIWEVMEDMRWKIVPLFLCAMLFAQPCQAFDKIFAKHCSGTKVPVELAKAVARQESALNPLCVNVAGKDFTPATRAEAIRIIRKAESEKRSYDVGLMQINSQWIRQWKIDPASLLDPDTNIRLGVRLLREEIGRHGLNWRAVGKYHSPNPERGRQYAGMVSRRIKGNALLKSKLSNPRLMGPIYGKRFKFKNYEPLNLIHHGALGQPHSQRQPVGLESAFDCEHFSTLQRLKRPVAHPRRHRRR